jgi:hypothetical protein
MFTAMRILPGVLVVAMAGCGNSEVSKRSLSPETQLGRPSESAGQLTDIGEPDGKEREFDGIRISGGALTDEHIAAIRALTDDTKPANPNRYLDRAIEHTGPNTATHIWQTGSAQFYKKLRLANGTWVIEEEGGGFGHW